MASEAPWRALHPASIAVNLLPRTWRVVRNLWPLLLALLWRGTDEDGTLLWFTAIDGTIVAIFFALTVGGTVWHWLTLRYRLEAGRLEIRTGLLNRQIRSIDPGRIQNVELVASPAHRVAGLVEVRVETASGSEVEGLLSAISIAEAEALRAALVTLRDAARAHTAPPDGDATGAPLIENGLPELFAYAATAGRIGAAAVMLGLLFEGVTWLAPERLGSFSVEILGLQGAALAIALLTGAWLIGLTGTIAAHWGFSLTQRDRALAVQAGLFTTRRLELPLSKVQLVMTSETLPRRWLGFGSLTLETAAPRSGAGGTERRAALVPYVPRERLAELARVAIPDLDVDPWTATLHPPHPRALARAIARRAVHVSLLTGLLVWWVGPWGALLLAALGPAAAIAWLDHRHQGWLVTERSVVARRGFLDRRLVALSRSRLQSVTALQGPLMRRLGLGVVVVRAAGSSVSLPAMSWDRARALVRELAAPDRLGARRAPNGPDLSA
jgi:putative membrane protein